MRNDGDEPRRATTGDADRPRPTRRRLLRAGGLALTVGLAGCHGPGRAEYVGLAVSIGEVFDAAPPVEVPLEVRVSLQAVDSRDVAVRGVELLLADEQRSELGRVDLGAFSYESATPSKRKQEDVPGGTAYLAEHRMERTVDADSVPALVGFRVGEVVIADHQRTLTGTTNFGSAGVYEVPTDDFDERTSVPAEGDKVVAGSVLRYEGPRPVPERVGPADYAAVTVGYEHQDAVNGSSDGTELLASPATPSSTATAATAGDGSATRTGDGSGTRTGDGSATRTGDGSGTAAGDGSATSTGGDDGTAANGTATSTGETPTDGTASATADGTTGG